MFPCLAAEPLPDRRDEQRIYNRAFPIKRKRKVTQSVKEKPIVYQSLVCQKRCYFPKRNVRDIVDCETTTGTGREGGGEEKKVTVTIK